MRGNTHVPSEVGTRVRQAARNVNVVMDVSVRIEGPATPSRSILRNNRSLRWDLRKVLIGVYDHRIIRKHAVECLLCIVGRSCTALANSA